MGERKMKKLLLIGSGSVHTYNYYDLIKNYFDDTLLITSVVQKIEGNISVIKGDFTIKKPIKAWKNFRFIKRAILEYTPDLIHVQQANSTAFLTLLANRKKNIPVIVTAWGSDVLKSPGSHFLLKKMVRYNLKQADYLTCDANIVAKKMLELEPDIKNEILVANFGINPFSRKTQKENIIYCNRLHKKLYRIDSVIEGFNRFIKNTNENWKLVLAGSGEETENLKKLVNKLGIQQQIDFIGWVGKTVNYEMYNKSKLYISIPESDATAISLLEAMHAGCLPIVSDLPANHEWITDGVNGKIAYDLEGDYISESLKIDSKKATKNNKHLIEEHGFKDANRKKFFSLYDKALNH